MIICEKCANFSNCECVPYDVECDNNFKEKVGVNDISDAQIIKALQKVKGHRIVTGNVCVGTNTFDYVTVAQLIEIYNRQQADIRKLQLENEKLEIKLKGKIESSNKSRDSAMEVIKKQEAEIERLQELATEKQNLTEQWQDEVKQLIMRNEVAKSEAIKEFAERLKERQQTFIGDEYTYKFIYLIEIDNLVKEMVGESYV